MRRWSRFLMAGMLVAVVGLYPLLAPPLHRIDQVHFERISHRMSREQVEEIFGVPPGEYDWAEEDPDSFLVRLRYRFSQPWSWTETRTQPSVWISRHGNFWVSFDDENRVISTMIASEVRIVPPWQRWWRNWKI